MLLKALRRKKNFGPGQREMVNIWITTKLIPWGHFQESKNQKMQLNYLATYSMYFQFHFMLS